MSGTLNHVMLIGNLGRDPEVRYLADGTAVASFSIATSENWTDKNTGEKKERTEWHRIVVWRQGAELAGQYLSKGSKVCIKGKLQTRQWEDKDGNDRYTTEIVADPFGGMIFLSSKKSSQSNGYHYQGGVEPPGGYAQGPPSTAQQRPQPGQQRGATQPEFPYGGGPASDDDSDIPF